MNLDKVINTLLRIKEKHGGDIPVFVNGEHGDQNPELSEECHFAVGAADSMLDQEDIPDWLPQENIIMQIGGY